MCKLLATLLILACGIPAHADDTAAMIARAKAALSQLQPAPQPEPVDLQKLLRDVTELRERLEAGQAPATLPPEAQPTSYANVGRALNLLAPKAGETLVDYGCGADARVCIAAARYYGCRAIGVEIDRERAASARVAVRAAGVGDLVQIVEGDATTVDVTADIGFVYLWPDTLAKLRPKLERLDRFVSHQHAVPGLKMERHGDLHLWKRPVPTATVQHAQPTAVWGGFQYTHPVCSNPACAMCASIRAQLAAQASGQQRQGRWVKQCTNGVCRYVWVPQ